MDRFDAMTAFVAVAEQRGFAPASRRLGLSPSAVTRLVASLEDRLKTRLLTRTTRAVSLTDAGVRYLARARRILSELAEAESSAQAEQALPQGRLLVAAPLVFGRLHVAPLVCAFLRRYPEVTAELTLSDRYANLVDEGIDVAIRIGQLPESSLVQRRIGETRRVVVASPAFLDQFGRPGTPQDLAGRPAIQCTALVPTHDWRFVRDGHEERVTVEPRYVTNSADAALWHAERDGGHAVVLAYQAEAAVRAGRLEVVLAAFEPPPSPIQIVFPSSRLLSRAVRAFVDMAAETSDWSFVDLRRS